MQRKINSSPRSKSLDATIIKTLLCIPSNSHRFPLFSDVPFRLLSYTYGQTSVFELASGFFAYYVTMGFHGFKPDRLYNLNGEWTNQAINDLEDSYGQEWSYNSRNELGFTAQTAFFASIVLTQISNVIICKTRRLSLFQQGMRSLHFRFVPST